MPQMEWVPLADKRQKAIKATQATVCRSNLWTPALEVQDAAQPLIYQVYQLDRTKSGLHQDSSMCLGWFGLEPKARYTCAE